MAAERYSKDHEYIRVDGDIATIGITDHAQKELGDVVFVEVPEIGKRVKAGDQAAVVESVKAASEIYAPVSGEVIAANTELAGDPALVNSDPMGKAWFMKIRLSDVSELDGLMDKDAYEAFIVGT